MKNQPKHKTIFHKIHFHLKPHYPYILVILLAFSVLQCGILLNNYIYNKSPVMGLHFKRYLVGSPMLASYDKRLISTVVDHARKIPITITAANFNEKNIAENLGSVIDVQSVSNQIYSYGREKDLPTMILHQDLAFFGFASIGVKASNTDPVKLGNYVEYLNQKIIQKPIDASFYYQDQRVSVRDSREGYEVDKLKLMSALKELNINRSAAVAVPLIYTAPEITTENMNGLLPQARQIASVPLTITAQNQTLTLDQPTLAGLLIVNKNKNQLALGLDLAKLSTDISKLVGKINISATPAISDGEEILSQGKPGQRFVSKPESIIASVLLARTGVAKISQNLDLMVEPVPPPVVIQKPKYIHITIDDVPNASTAQILDVLKQYNVKVTFFVIGSFADANPEVLKMVAANGHTLGNHSYSHPWLTSLAEGQVREELQRCQDAVKNITGITMTLWRPPYSNHNASVDAIASSLGLRIMMYNDNPNDSTSFPGPHIIALRVFSQAKPDGIIILHSQPQTLAALPEIITGLRSRGYKIR